jgi:soluble lytic murein transglycosylase-like protein
MMTFTQIILAAAKAAKVSGPLLLAICTHESGLQNAFVLHDGGSPTYGVCQLKLGSAQMVGFKGSSETLMIPEVNAKYSALYLKRQLDRYDGNTCKATAAYNAGKYSESTKNPGKPKNLRYIKKVQAKLLEDQKDELSCEAKKSEESAYEANRMEMLWE